MKRFLPTAITMVVGIVTLATFFLSGIEFLRVVLVDWAIVVAAFAMILGGLNVLSVHLTQVFSRRPGGFYSFFAVASFVLVLLVSVLDAVNVFAKGAKPELIAQQGLSGPVMLWAYEYILIPIQSSLAALLPFLLAFAAYRTLRMRTTTGKLGGALFMLSAILVLLGQAAMVFNLPVLSQVREWILRVGAMAGMRGILLGVALGITATALRVLTGADRPTSD